MQESVGGTKAERGDEAKHSKLLLVIVTWGLFNDGFYYEYPDSENPNINYIIDFDYDIDGYEIVVDGN